ncbi:MAG: FAD-dependent oxidoreductase [Polyangiaceae bacterium]|jgi:thioredoxin reductase (NADPH)
MNPSDFPVVGAVALSRDDPYARRDQMFPKLSPDQIERLRSCGHERSAAAGELLFDQGQSDIPLFVVLSGSVEIVHPSRGADEPITVHEPGEFTGEVVLLSGRRSLVRGRARTASRLLVIEQSRLRSLVQTDAELSELFLRAFILRRMGLVAHGQGDVVLVGSRHSSGTLRLQEFLTRSTHPFTYVDVETDASVQGLLDTFHVAVDDVPVVICRGERVLKNPTNSELADCLGFNPTLDSSALRDLVVVGAGPGGLAAAVYAASEGLDVLVLESETPGGQAGSSSKIENYLGFPTGISGGALAGRALTQAEKFGAEVVVAKAAVGFLCERRPYSIDLGGGVTVRARTVIIATGAAYRKPEIAGLARFEGAGVYYGATHVEAQRCKGDEIAIVGGGNSAGQAAVYLSRVVRHVHMLIRGEGLVDSMSRYLIRRIEETPNITLRTRTRLESIEGGDHLESVVWTDDRSGETTRHDVRHVFLMTGAKPNSDWLSGCVVLDDKGFVKTGMDLSAVDLVARKWPMKRTPYLLETSLPGVFAVGDIRAANVKRVASAVGEGSICIQLVHRALSDA